MKTKLEPVIARQIQDAIDQGKQVVLIPTPGPARLASAAPTCLRNRSEPSLTAACCLLFKLERRESGMLVQLLARDFGAKEELRAAMATLAGRTVTDNNMHTVISALRRKLEPYDIRISTVPKVGYALDRDARDKIHTMLARYDAEYSPKRPRSKGEAPKPDASP